jgi:dTDP-4-dehydrorhamnose 3,5-epimerase
MEFVPTAVLPDVVLVKPRVFEDDRGYFLETWQEEKFAAAGVPARFVQDNHSRSARHTLRGLHYQIVRPQGKLVRVTRGSVLDVAVDIRRSSPTFGRWVGVELSEENHYMLWVPAGFAHGYLAISEQADFLYKCTDFWFPQHERGIAWNDPDLGIDWPLAGGSAELSAKDRAAPAFRNAECFP